MKAPSRRSWATLGALARSKSDQMRSLLQVSAGIEAPNSQKKEKEAKWERWHPGLLITHQDRSTAHENRGKLAKKTIGLFDFWAQSGCRKSPKIGPAWFDQLMHPSVVSRRRIDEVILRLPPRAPN